MHKTYDKYGGLEQIKGTRTGFFHYEEIDGRYWFVTPEGNAFFAVALSHLFSGESDLACQNLFDGDVDSWMRSAYEKGKAMGYNCALGSATSPERNLNGFIDIEKVEAMFRADHFPFAVGVILLKHPWEFEEGETLPDIYDPSYQSFIEERAASICPKYKDDPLVMGYYYGFGAFNHSDGWVNHHMSMPPGSAGRNAIADILTRQYCGDVTAFNAVYGTTLHDFAELKTHTSIRYGKEMDQRNYPSVRQTIPHQQFLDFEAIISDMCIRLYKIAHDAIRKWDTHHLIFGSFIKEWVLSSPSWKSAAPYVDLMSPQHLNREISLNAVADELDMPMIISDEDAGWYYENGIQGHCGLISHDARAHTYHANLLRHYKDRQVIGVSYCGCMYDQGGKTLKKKLQNGFYDLFTGHPRTQLIETVTKINQSVYDEAIHPAPNPSALGQYTDAFYKAWDTYLSHNDTGFDTHRELIDIFTKKRQ